MIIIGFKMIFGAIKLIMSILAIIIGCCLGVIGFLISACVIAGFASIYSPKMTT